jgi:TPR repeat protein
MSAEGGDPGGQFNYAVCLEKGTGIVKNFSLAAEYYRILANQGNGLARQGYERCSKK